MGMTVLFTERAVFGVNLLVWFCFQVGRGAVALRDSVLFYITDFSLPSLLTLGNFQLPRMFSSVVTLWENPSQMSLIKVTGFPQCHTAINQVVYINYHYLIYVYLSTYLFSPSNRKKCQIRNHIFSKAQNTMLNRHQYFIHICISRQNFAKCAELFEKRKNCLWPS